MFACKQHIQQAVRITETDPESSYAHESRDIVQIEAPDFDPDIDGISPPSTDETPNKPSIQRTSPPTPKVTEPENDCLTPATTIQQLTSQDTDWPDAIPVQIPSSIDQPEDQGCIRHQAQQNSKSFKIPDLEENSEEEQFADLDSYHTSHTTTHMKLANISIKNIDPTCMP